MYRTLDTSHFPEENECGFVYFRDDDQLFSCEEINSESFPFSNESCIHFPLPEGPLMEKVVLIYNFNDAYLSFSIS